MNNAIFRLCIDLTNNIDDENAINSYARQLSIGGGSRSLERERRRID